MVIAWLFMVIHYEKIVVSIVESFVIHNKKCNVSYNISMVSRTWKHTCFLIKDTSRHG